MAIAVGRILRQAINLKAQRPPEIGIVFYYISCGDYISLVIVLPYKSICGKYMLNTAVRISYHGKSDPKIPEKYWKIFKMHNIA